MNEKNLKKKNKIQIKNLLKKKHKLKMKKNNYQIIMKHKNKLSYKIFKV